MSLLTSLLAPGNGTYASEGVLYLPGVAGNYTSTPDTADLDILGDIDVRIKVALDDWTPAANQCLIGKSVDSGSQVSWRLQWQIDNLPFFRWTTDGSTVVTATATATAGTTNGEPLWVRVTLDVDNGAGGYDVKFYTSPAADGATWTQLGATITGGATTSIFASTSAVEVGSRNAGANDMLAGRVWEAQVYNGIDGTLVYNPIFDHPVTAWGVKNSTYRDSTGRVTTINGDQAEWRPKA